LNGEQSFRRLINPDGVFGTHRLLDLGGTAPPKADRGPAYLAKLPKADIARWDPILKAAAAKMN
jgi:hypothetical protein